MRLDLQSTVFMKFFIWLGLEKFAYLELENLVEEGSKYGS